MKGKGGRGKGREGKRGKGREGEEREREREGVCTIGNLHLPDEILATPLVQTSSFYDERFQIYHV